MSEQDSTPAVACAACEHVDFAHADWRGCAFGGCGCKRVNYGYGWLAPEEGQEGTWAPEISALICICPAHVRDGKAYYELDCGDCGSRQEAVAIYVSGLIADVEKAFGLSNEDDGYRWTDR